MWSQFLKQLRKRDTIITSLIVGTLINLYGQALVPVFRGSPDVFAEFMRDCVESPFTSMISIATGFLFPLLVSAYAGARATVEISAAASLAQFPDLKPDPVFRANDAGEIVEAGAQTRLMFEERGITRAKDILGDDLWRRIAETVRREGVLRSPETTYYEPADQWYVVTAAVAPGGINVYLTAAPRGGVRGASTPPKQRSA